MKTISVIPTTQSLKAVQFLPGMVGDGCKILGELGFQAAPRPEDTPESSQMLIRDCGVDRTTVSMGDWVVFDPIDAEVLGVFETEQFLKRYMIHLGE